MLTVQPAHPVVPSAKRLSSFMTLEMIEFSGTSGLTFYTEHLRMLCNI